MAIPFTARVPVPFPPPALAGRNPPVKIMCRVPTPYERDAFSSALVRGGVIHYNKSQIRELMLAGVGFLYGQEKFDEMRADLENLWDHIDARTEQHAEQQARLIELLEQNQSLPEDQRLDNEAMQADLDTIPAKVVIEERERVRITAIQQDITARYQPLQKAFADLAEQDVRRAWLCVEMYVTGWQGLLCEPAGNGMGGITREEAYWLRGQIGADAFDQVAQFIFAMHGLDEDEEKNLALLIESSSALTGSTPAESMGSSEVGTSLDALITATPGEELAKTTAPSSASTKTARKRTAKSASSQTDAP